MAQQLGSNYYNSPFKFNGKELDEETGFYYYGARYYDPKISIWLSVDPLAEKFPNWNPYNYTMQNPINLTDPSGMEPEEGGGDPCGTCGRRESKVQKAARIALVGLAQAYNVKKFFQADNEVSDSNVEASQLFYQWVMGTGKSNRNFNEKSVMGSQMLESEEVLSGIDNLIQNFKRGKGKTEKIVRSLSNENELMYLKSFIDDLDDNPARAFHGSFSGSATITGTETTTLGVYYSIKINISDKMSASSGTRLPPFLGGYDENAAIFNGPNPYGSNGYFRTININYDMNIKIFKYNTVSENAKKFWNFITN